MCVCLCSCEVDLSRVPVNQRQLFTHTLIPGRGLLVFLLTVSTCTSVSVSDLCAAPLNEPHERQKQLDNYVSTITTVEIFSVPSHRTQFKWRQKCRNWKNCLPLTILIWFFLWYYSRHHNDFFQLLVNFLWLKTFLSWVMHEDLHG